MTSRRFNRELQPIRSDPIQECVRFHLGENSERFLLPEDEAYCATRPRDRRIRTIDIDGRTGMLG